VEANETESPVRAVNRPMPVVQSSASREVEQSIVTELMQKKSVRSANIYH
jgi:hypothetical protein